MTPLVNPVALVTGIAGQDGTYLAEDLAARGWTVHGLVRSSTPIPLVLRQSPNIHLHISELTQQSAVVAAVRSCAPDHVFHLAGLSSVWRSWKDPLLATQVNTLTAAILLEACLQYQESSGQAVTMVNASSAEIFAGCELWPQTEQTPISPRSPYGASKACAHHLTQIYRTRGLKASNAILYSHESPRRSPMFVTRKITQAVARIALTRTGQLTLGNLDVRRDWGWAPDYVQALRLMAERDEADDFIVATGIHHSVRDFAQFAFEAAQVDDWERFLTVDEAFTRVIDAKLLVGDPTRAGERLGWTPTLDLKQVVQKMVEQDIELETTPFADPAAANNSDPAVRR